MDLKNESISKTFQSLINPHTSDLRENVSKGAKFCEDEKAMYVAEYEMNPFESETT